MPLDSRLAFESISQTDSTHAFRSWSRQFEVKVSQALSPGVQRADRSYFGRGQLTKPRQRRTQAAVPKHSRPGEVEQTCGFLNRASAAWYKQLRRLQSYRHAAQSHRQHETSILGWLCGILFCVRLGSLMDLLTGGKGAHTNNKGLLQPSRLILPMPKSSSGFLMTSIITTAALSITSGGADKTVARPNCFPQPKASLP